jgi:fatty-acyl-CoA synthase
MGDWNLADVYEVIAGKIPDAPCQVQGDRTVTWAEWDRRANGLAASLLDHGLGHQAKVAAYLTNCPEYLEVYLAAFKAGLVPVNTNYRYGAEEILYLFDNADAEAVVFHARFAPVVEEIRDRLPKVKAWYVVDDGSPLPDWAESEEAAAAAGTAEPVTGPWGRSGDDLLLLYTGGTTGMPKGVMWRQDDLFQVIGGGGNPVLGETPAKDLDDLASRIEGPGFSALAACPLMHGTGQFSALIVLNGGGAIVSLPSGKFDPAVLWQTAADTRVNAVIIVGDAFGRPMLHALEEHPDRWDLSNLLLITSSGVMWSQENKDGLMRCLPNTVMYDSLGSSEAVFMASSSSGAGQASETASFQIGDKVQVITDGGDYVAPGSDEIGMVAIRGYIPVGYYKDEEKSAKTFRTVQGVRYSIPGDYAQVLADGTIHLLGRGSVVINTAGEKVFPEEVEEVLKRHGTVCDAVVVGLPDERFGEVICALVECEPGASFDEAALIEFVRGRLARFKAPRRVLEVDTINRSPAGKVDYAALKRLATERAAGNAV